MDMPPTTPTVSPVLAACACHMHAARESHYSWLVDNCARVKKIWFKFMLKLCPTII